MPRKPSRPVSANWSSGASSGPATSKDYSLEFPEPRFCKENAMNSQTKIDPIVHAPPFPKNYADEFLVLDHGKGTEVWDKAGNRYLDFTGGIAVNALGHGRRDLA